jgi:chemotaxis protein CheZ
LSLSEREEILAALKALHELMECPKAGNRPKPSNVDELRQLKSDTDAIQFALNRTKQEIASLHLNAFSGAPAARVTRELNAVMESAEQATQQILDAAEGIDDAANTLSASLKREQEQALALDIQDNALRIFEACNFQDLSGQRIVKVLATLKFVEERIAHMVEIWGGIEAFNAYAAAAADGEAGNRLHGPMLDGDEGHASQAGVDALFAKRGGALTNLSPGTEVAAVVDAPASGTQTTSAPESPQPPAPQHRTRARRRKPAPAAQAPA